MRTLYTFGKRLNDGLVGLQSKYGIQLWSRTKLRKDSKCAVCEDPIAKGTTAFSPLTNDMNRMERVCEPCVTVLEKKAAQ
jgi:hypothetical protein